MHGPVALVGSGEYLPVMQDVEAALIASRPQRYVQLPTAAALEGDAVLERWIRLGREQAVRLGVEAVPLRVVDADSANDDSLAAQVSGAGLVYLSGGNPHFLATTLRDSAVWREIYTAWHAGAALAGCSAGAMALTDWVPHLREPDAGGAPGLGVVPHMRVIPHFDKFAQWMPNVVERYLPHLGADNVLVGIDEETALVSDDKELHMWQVQGKQSVWVITAQGRTEYPSGTALRIGG